MISSDGSFTPPAISAPCWCSLALRRRAPGRRELGVGLPGGRVQHRRRSIGAGRGRRGVSATWTPSGGRSPSLELPLERFGLVKPTARAARPVLRPRAEFSGIDDHAVQHRAAAAARRPPAGRGRGRAASRADYREASDSLRDRRLDQRDGRRHRLVRPRGHDHRRRAASAVRRRVRRAQPRASRTCCWPTAPISPWTSPSCRRWPALIEEARALQDAPPGELRISRFQAGLWEELAGTRRGRSPGRRLAAAGRRAAVGWLGRCRGSGELRRPAPAGPLRPYQLDGFGWLAFLWEHRLGGILADDMGLGKTLQALALICHARQAEPERGRRSWSSRRPASCPNWAAEAARFAPGLEGGGDHRHGARRGQPLASVVARRRRRRDVVHAAADGLRRLRGAGTGRR